MSLYLFDIVQGQVSETIRTAPNYGIPHFDLLSESRQIQMNMELGRFVWNQEQNTYTLVYVSNWK